MRFFVPHHHINYPFEFLIDGKHRTVELGGWIQVNDSQNYIASAVHGHGLIQIPALGVEAHLCEGRLVQVLADWPSPPVPVWLLTPSHPQRPPRMQRFIEWVTQVYAKRFGAR